MSICSSIGSKGDCLNLVIRQGSTFGPFTMTLTNPDESPMDLTGTSFDAHIRKYVNADVAVDIDVQITDAVNGVIQFTIDSATTAALTCGNKETDLSSIYQWDMEMTDTLGRIIPIVYGQVSVFREITR